MIDWCLRVIIKYDLLLVNVFGGLNIDLDFFENFNVRLVCENEYKIIFC